MKGIKKILLGLLLLVSTISLSQGFTMGNRILMGSTVPSEITLTSTSVLASWSPDDIVNSGTTLDWTVSGGVTIAKTTVNDPTFNFSTNSGTANVLIENTDDLTTFDVRNLSIVTADLANGINLEVINVTTNLLTSFSSVTNVNATEIQTSFNSGLTSHDISNNTLLTFYACVDNSYTSLDISNNTLLTFLGCEGNGFSTAVTNQILADLVFHGLSNGILNYRSNETGQGVTDRATLITRGWTITNFGA